MLINKILPREKNVPRNLLTIAAILSVVALLGGVALYGYSLFLHFMWEQVSTTRQYYTLGYAKKQKIESSIDRLHRLIDPASQAWPAPEAVSSKIAAALSSLPPGSSMRLDFTPNARPVTLLVNRPLNAREIADISRTMARVVDFDRVFWGLRNIQPRGRTNLILADGSAALIVPALNAYDHPNEITVQKLFDFWAVMVANYLQKISEEGKETVWSPAYVGRLRNANVITYAAPVKDAQGKLIAVIDFTVSGEQLLGNVLDKDDELITTGRQVAFFNRDGELLYRGKDTWAYDFSGLGQRINQRLGNRGHAEIYWFEQGALMIGGMRSQQAWRSLYIYPLPQALFDYRWPLAIAIGLFLIGSFTIYRGVQVVRRRVLLPMQRNAEEIEETARFTRTMLRIAPVGLRVVRLADGHPKAENELAQRILPHDTLHEGHRWFDWLPIDSPGRFQLQLAGDDGSARHLQIVSAPVRYQHDDVLLCVISDMTEEIHIRASLQHAREVADNDNKLKTMFLAAMSHEIRTPLYGMIGMLELLMLTELNASQRQQLDTIQTSSHVLLQVLNGLLDYIKFEVGQMKLEISVFDPIDLVETAVRAQFPIARRKKLRLTCLLQPDLPWVAGDPMRMRQILDNLLGNALKFTELGEVSVRMAAEKTGDPSRIRLRLEVADTGIGISPEAQLRLFEPFYQGESASGQRFVGTGLGLPICQRIAGLMHGKVVVRSIRGQGSLFTSVLELGCEQPRTVKGGLPPVVVLCNHAGQRSNLIDIIVQAGAAAVGYGGSAPPPGAVLLMATARPQAVPEGYADVVRLRPDGPLQAERHLGTWVVNAYSQKGLRRALRQASGHEYRPQPADDKPTVPWLGLHVLVAEDHPYNRQMIQSQLEQLGCHVQLTGNGKEALAAIRQDDFDVLLTDAQMPVMDGYELAGQLRADGHTLPVIGLTAHALQEEHQRLLAAGMNSVLTKPILLQDLADRLRSVLPERVAQRQAESQQDMPHAGIGDDTYALLRNTLIEDTRQLQAAFERSDLRQAGQLAHRINGAMTYAEGGEEIAALCGELEQKLAIIHEEMRTHVDDIALYVNEFIDKET